MPPHARTCFAASRSIKRNHSDPTGPFRDPVGTRFGRGFLSPSCPTLATTPVPSTPSAKPGPDRVFSFARAPVTATPPASRIKCINLQHFQKPVQRQTPAHLSTYAHPLRPTVAHALPCLGRPLSCETNRPSASLCVHPRFHPSFNPLARTFPSTIPAAPRSAPPSSRSM